MELERKGTVCAADIRSQELFWNQKATYALTEKSLQTTKQYQQFRTAGTEGITGCDIRSIILPLLADHVLREANHYLRILEEAQKRQGVKWN